MTESALYPHPRGRLLGSGAVGSYRVDEVHALEPFFMPLVSAGDGWGFVSSTGALTVGRRSADESLFPYRTDDQLLDGVGSSGSWSDLRAPDGDGVVRRWRPFVDEAGHAARRAVEKTLVSDEVTLEERRSDLGLCVRVGWRLSTHWGVIRTTTLTSSRDDHIEVDVDDGVVNILPPGAGERVQRELSTLLDAYKLTELDESSGVAWTRLNASLTDLAEAAESWRASTMWGEAPDELRPDIRPPSAAVRPERSAVSRTRGRRAAYRFRGSLRLAPGESRSWHVVLDTGQDAAAVADLVHARRTGAPTLRDLASDLARDRIRLRRLVASADGEQATGDVEACAHHTSSVVFNLLRGGVPVDGLRVRRADIEAFLDLRHRGWERRWGAVVRSLPPRMAQHELAAVAESTHDVDLRRLLGEYLPLTFSRRHGDPSRPWNRFAVKVADASGAPILRYEGNWRDIIQNWEALGVSFPPLLDAMTRVILDAMTVDGYNPYRLAIEGPDWEVPDPDDPWANIGYWSDHQVVYLHQLLRHRHDLLGRWTGADLTRPDYVFADVPYRLAPWRDVLDGCTAMVTFDETAHARTMRRAEQLGGDGLLRVDEDGHPVRASLAEKLLLIVAAKTVNLVPGHGIWMTTQRPEWNDANNALVGRGVSLVTAAQLRAFVADLLDWFEPLGDDEGTVVGTTTLELSEPLALLVDRLARVLGEDRTPGGRWTASARAEVMARLGDAGDAFRSGVHGADGAHRSAVPLRTVRSWLRDLVIWLDDAVAASWGPDGLVSSYGVLEGDATSLTVRPLGPMLEGQVAVLAAGSLDPERAAELVGAVRASALWTPDRETFLLYPDREVPGFLERARVPASGHGVGLLGRLAGSPDRRLVAAARDGAWYFGGDLRNAGDVERVLDDLARDPQWADAVAEERQAVLDVFEEAVDHAAYTGRSGTFFAYEGLGSVYWHMVSKYLAAILSAADAVPPGPGHDAVRDRLREAAEEVRAGLLSRRTPEQVGAVPVDPYSHTPSGQGARQPGMTGQVKEDILVRWRDLGLCAADGSVAFRPDLVSHRDRSQTPAVFEYLDVDGSPATVDLAAGDLAFTWCQVPVHYSTGRGARSIVLTRVDGSQTTVEGWTLPADALGDILRRTGAVRRVTVTAP